MKLTRPRFAIATVGAAAFAFSAVAAAQSGSGTEAATLEEIVVTAQKREQSLQDVPVAVTAVSSETLERQGITQFSELTKVAPSLTVSQGNTTENSSINLRGIGTYAFSPSIESAVAVIVDDVPLLQQGQAFSSLADIERVEVLRGPQGTLFGKNASAGVINIVTKAPSRDWSGSVNVLATDDKEYRAQSSVSGPLGARAGMRLSGFYGDREGNVVNLDTGHRLNGDTSYGFRGRLDFKALDNLDLSAIAAYSNQDTDGIARTFRLVPEGARVAAGPVQLSPAPALVGVRPGDDNYNIRLNTEPQETNKQTLASLKAALDLGSVSLVSVSSYQNWKYTSLIDNDGTNFVTNVSTADTKAHNFTQELRLVSAAGTRFEYLAGVFYSDGSTTRAFTRGTPLANWSADAGIKSYAAFGQGTLHFGSSTHLDAGVRFNRQDIDVVFRNLAGVIATYSGNSSEDATTYKVALRQNLSDSVMAYVSYATGYKGEGYDISTGFTQLRADNPIKREDSDAYEAGFKGRFLGGRLQTNLAGFLTDYYDFQAQGAVVQPDGTIQFVLNNVGKLQTKGVEFDLSALPLAELRLDVGGAYTDATIKSFAGAQCYVGQTAAQGCVNNVQNLAGQRLSNAPKLKYYVSANYDIALGSLPFAAFIGADYQHQSAVNFDLFQNPRAAQDGYGIANLSVGIKDAANDRYRVTLFANNLFDKHYATSIGNAFGVWTPTALTPSAQVLARDSQRYYGVRASYKF